MDPSPTLLRLVRAAVNIYARPDRLPGAVRDRAVVQHLSAAGLVRSVAAHHDVRPATSSDGTVVRIGAEAASAADAVAWHAGLAGWLELDDHLLRGRSCAATAAAAWAGTTRDHTWDQVLAATVAGNELAGRLGLATLLGAPEWGCAPATAAATALVTGLLAGRTADEIAGSVAWALSDDVQAVSDRPARDPSTSADASAARRGVRSLDQRGDLRILDGTDSILARWSWRPLPGALAGMGTVWLTDTITHRSLACAPAGQTAVEAVAEILARHVKAADKRLRVDQVERIELRVPAAAAGLGVEGALEPASVPWSMPNLLGVLVAQHSLGPADLTPEVLQRRQAEVAAVASKVDVVVDRGLGARALHAQLEVLGPLFGGLGWKDARTVLQRTLAGERKAGRPSRDRLQIWARLVRSLWQQRGVVADLTGVAIDGWQLHLPVEVNLYTTRGGRWPERRSLPTGGPGAPWQPTVDTVVRRFTEVSGCADTPQAMRTADPQGSGFEQVCALTGASADPA